METLRGDSWMKAARIAAAALALWSARAEAASATRVPASPEPPAASATDATERRADLTTVVESLRSTLDKVAQSTGPAKAPGEQVRPQLDPSRPPASVYPDAAAIEYAILAVPDPRVPRHRRSYEQALRSVIAGMSDSLYVLDRYYFPWQDYASDKTSAQNDRWTSKDQVDDGRYGVLVFRHDDWRDGANLYGPTPTLPYTLRVLYVVPETVTAGVQHDALRNAMNDIVDEVEGNAIDSPSPAELADADASNDPGVLEQCNRNERHRYLMSPQIDGGDKVRTGRVLMIGPNFSSSVGNVTRIARAQVDSDRVVVPYAVRAQLERLRNAVTRMEAEASSGPACVRRSVDAYRRFRDDFASALDGRSVALRQRVAETVPPVPVGCPSVSVREAAAIAGRVSDYFAAANVGCAQFRAVVAFSPSTTVESNDAVNALSPRRVVAFRSSTAGRNLDELSGHIFEFHSLAVNDRRKVVGLLEYFDADSDLDRDAPIALLYETSSFGLGVYESLHAELEAQDGRAAQYDAHPRRLMGAAFPPNIADLRKQLRDGDAAAKRKAGVIDLSTESYLSIEEGAENGNEYPDGGSSQLTPVAAEQQLRHLLASLRAEPKPPGAVIVAATDVRDRLYLFDRISRELPNAILVDLEADVLLAHPDYVHATRGALMMSSALLSSVPSSGVGANGESVLRGGICDAQGNAATRYSFDSDRQALLYEIVRCVGDGWLHEPAPLLYRIGRRGPTLVGSSASAYESVRNDASLSLRGARFAGTALLLVAMSLALYAAWTAFRREQWQPASTRAGKSMLDRVLRIVGAPMSGFAPHASRAEAGGEKPARSEFALRNDEIVGAPWQEGRRAGIGLVASYLAAIVVAAIAVLPFLEQFVGVRSYFDAPTASALRVACLVLMPFAIVAIAFALGRAAYGFGGRRGWRPGACRVVAVGVCGVGLLAECAIVWPALSVYGWVPPATLLWVLQFDLWAVAVIALVLLLALIRRAKRWTFYAEILIRSAQGGKDLSDWADVEGPKPRFVATPIQAGLYGNMQETHAMRPVVDLRRQIAMIEAGFRDTLDARMTLRRLLWPSLNAIALAALAIVLCYFGIIVLAWLYPVPGRGVPLVIGMLVAGIGATLLVSNAIAFERSSLLSRLFCGTDKGLQISSQLLTIVTGPVLLLLLSIVAADQPGVLEWSGGVVKMLTGGR